LRSGQFYLDTLEPTTEAQKAALAAAVQAHAASGTLRLQMVLALTNPVPYPLMASWSGWVAWIVRARAPGPARRPAPGLFTSMLVDWVTPVYLSRFV
jgi:hypothetical protein